MTPVKRFRIIMAVLFLIAAVFAVWRIVVADGSKIWYVPLVLVLAAVAMATDIRDKRNRTQNKK